MFHIHFKTTDTRPIAQLIETDTFGYKCEVFPNASTTKMMSDSSLKPFLILSRPKKKKIFFHSFSFFSLPFIYTVCLSICLSACVRLWYNLFTMIILRHNSLLADDLFAIETVSDRMTYSSNTNLRLKFNLTIDNAQDIR